MIAIGTNNKPLERVMFMPDVTEAQRSKYLMRPERQCRKCLMNAKCSEVKPEGILKDKSCFVLVDCVGVTETDKTETPKACKTGILENFDLQPVFIKQSTIEAAA